jgi:hypothetical protein
VKELPGIRLTEKEQQDEIQRQISLIQSKKEQLSRYRKLNIFDECENQMQR